MAGNRYPRDTESPAATRRNSPRPRPIQGHAAVSGAETRDPHQKEKNRTPSPGKNTHGRACPTRAGGRARGSAIFSAVKLRAFNSKTRTANGTSRDERTLRFTHRRGPEGRALRGARGRHVPAPRPGAASSETRERALGLSAARSPRRQACPPRRGRASRTRAERRRTQGTPTVGFHAQRSPEQADPRRRSRWRGPGGRRRGGRGCWWLRVSCGVSRGV